VFHKVLIANRAEIAVRVAATCQAMGIVAAAVYSDADAQALHVRLADEAYPIGPAPAAQSYLNIEAIMEAAERAGADALHPGYGFLAENPALAEACREAGVTFIGPGPEAMRLLGNKIAAKRLARQAGVPTVPGYLGGEQEDDALLAQAREIGMPLLIKAAAGGGGRGMREVRDPADLPDALAAARREARAAFGDGTVLLERLVESPRHVEVQVIGDAHGTVLHLGERECSVQRRHQKIIEEAPSPAVSAALRAEMGMAAVRVAGAAGYTNAGTVEFLLAPDGSYYFLEMNARLQVEHPVTELVTGLDLVALQLRVAAGERLPFGQEDVTLRGHALECRVYAEDPATGFLPSTGRLIVFDPPRGPGVRVDAGVAAGDEVSVHYDPLLAKLITAGETRLQALDRALWALERFPVLGVTANVAFLQRIVAHRAFRAGDLSTDFVERHLQATERPRLDRHPPTAPLRARKARVAKGHVADRLPPTAYRLPPLHEALLLAAFWQVTAPAANPLPPYDPWRAASGWSTATTRTIRLAGEREDYAVEVTRAVMPRWVVRIGDDTYDVTSAGRDGAHGLTLRLDGRVLRGHVAQREGALLVTHAGMTWSLRLVGPPDVDAAARHAGVGGLGAPLEAPMPGTVIKVYVREGQRVEAQQRVMVLEAMKMEHVVEAPYGGVVRAVLHGEGELVAAGEKLVEIEEA
jgi:3-methylcrotonyl-CoA carboxylase alpha subunit